MPWADLIFVQKILPPSIFFLFCRWLGKKTAFEFDDAIFTGRHLHPAPTVRLARRSRKAFDAACEKSDLLTFTSPEFEPFVSASGTPQLILAGPIDTDRHVRIETGERRDTIVIGWIGSSSTTPYLNRILPALLQVKEENQAVELWFVGAAPAALDGAHEAVRPWSHREEVALLQGFDIGVAPLADDPWARLKGGYKVLQYMAVGLPVVASPVGIQAHFVKDGENGFLASTREEWATALRRLLSDPDERREMGRRGREMAEEDYSLRVGYVRLKTELLSLLDQPGAVVLNREG